MQEHLFLQIVKPTIAKLYPDPKDNSVDGARQKYIKKGLTLLHNWERARVQKISRYQQYYKANMKKLDSYHLDSNTLSANDNKNKKLSKSMSYLDLKRKNMKELDEEELLIRQVSLNIDQTNLRMNATT